MRTWPRGVTPAGLSANARGIEFLYRAPDDRWFRVEASLQPRAPAGVQVRALPGSDPSMGERLAKAVERQLVRAPLARSWLDASRHLVERLACLRSFGGPGSEADEHLDQLLALLDSLDASEDRSSGAGLELDAILERARAGLDPAVIDELGVVSLLAAGEFDRALDHWHRHADAITARSTRSARACAAIMHGYLGQVPQAHAAARELAASARVAVDARYAGELLAQLGLDEAAASALRFAASDAVLDDAGAFAVHFRLAQVAAAAHDLDTLRWAAAAMQTHADRPDQLIEAARMQQEAGEFAAADALLEGVLREQPGHRGAALMLAQTRLWRLDHEAAAALCRPLVAGDARDVAGLRTLGACEHLAGNHARALELLGAALDIDGSDYQAQLWRAEILDHLGRYSEAADEIRSVGIGDYPIWQLLRALIEEHHVPGRRIAADTWFIVDTNIRQIVPDDEAPADTGASHEVACAAIRQAIDELGGNRTKRLTTLTPSGELRWLRTVESPRQRAELLQLQACHRDVDAVVADFAALTERFPAVPFFHTYPAELLLWRGEYERAYAMFEAVWLATRTRWGYVGAGAAAMLLGRDARALEVWEEGKEYYSYIDAEATYCYRGELLRRRGDLDAAAPDLELAVTARPGRVGAWINLALLHHATGDEAGLREAVAKVEGLVPAYAWEARRAVEIDDGAGPVAPDRLARYMDTLLAWMRGNRSSVMHTIVDARERLRVVPAVGPEIWRDHGRRCLALFADELLSTLARRS